MTKKQFSLDLGNGTKLEIETGYLAPQANGAVKISIGETVVLATACMGRKPTDLDFLPLSVAYQEKFYASGIIKHSKVNKREARPSDEKVLIGRVIDRGLRPLFPKGFNNNLQTILTVLSYDNENEHDIVSAIGASAAFTISDAPFEGPTATVRVGLVDGELILNTPRSLKDKSKLDLIVTTTKDNVVMIESKANEVSEEKMFEAIEFWYQAGKKICEFLLEVQKEVGKEKITYTPTEVDSRIVPMLEEKYSQIVDDTIYDESLTKLQRFGKFDDLKEEAGKLLPEILNKDADEDNLVTDKDVISQFGIIIKWVIRKSILEQDKRIKGRKMDEIRPLASAVDILPRPHGSAVFERGETQGLTTVTLGGPGDKLYKTGIEGEEQVRYFHHYNFPPYSVGEVSTRLFTGNREIWHGALAEKALLAVLPSEEDFPYTIRTVTEILSSNGSSSMAAVCGSTLALMDAGVPLKRPVAGIAMGLMTDKDTGNYKILTDLQDEEDFGGDMDFKVAGTTEGITAIQMDIKLKGIPMPVFKEGLEKARLARLQILDVMAAAIPEPRAKLKKYAPRIESIQIDPEMIKKVIGKGGEIINGIIKDTGVGIDISEEGLVTITGWVGTDIEKAMQIVEQIVEVPKVGKIYEGKVAKIMEFGAFVTFMPRTDGLVHISQLSKERVNKVEDVVKEDQIVKVKLVEVDKMGRYKLTMLVD